MIVRFLFIFIINDFLLFGFLSFFEEVVEKYLLKVVNDGLIGRKLG